MTTELLTWAVAFKIDKKNYDDRKTRVSVVASFRSTDNAKDFIEKCLPEDTKDKFFIISLDELEKCDDYDHIQKVTDKFAKVI